MARYRIETSDRQDHLLAVKAEDFYFALWDMANFLRNKVKWNDMLFTGKVYEELEEEFYDILRDRNINFDMVE